MIRKTHLTSIFSSNDHYYKISLNKGIIGFELELVGINSALNLSLLMELITHFYEICPIFALN
jgi:hypothetical protein